MERILRSAAVVLVSPLLFAVAARGDDPDCNGNGVPDSGDIAAGTSLDCNGNGNPDECDIRPVNFGFEPTGLIEIGKASAVSAGDLDGDGNLDLMGVLSFGDVTWSLGAGRGEFPESVYLPVASSPRDVALCDTDGDTRLDAACATADGISILRWDGTGGFGGEIVVPLIGGAQTIDAGDLDGDGRIDFVAANDSADRSIVSLLGLGKGAFLEKQSLPAGEGPRSVALEDLDGDGDLDLAATGESEDRSIISLFKSHGDGRFDPAVVLIPGSIEPLSLAAADLDGDGDPDLAELGSWGATTAIPGFRNRGAGSFDRASWWKGASSLSGNRLVAADLDGDRDADLISVGKSIVSLLNGGAGSFEVANDLQIDASPLGAALAADLDLDGDLDLAAPGDLGIFIFTNRPVSVRPDRDLNGVPDECDPDCDCDGDPDGVDLAEEGDCDGNGIPDGCDPDCNVNLLADACDIARGSSSDCDGDGIPDECDLGPGDLDGNGIPDSCDIAAGAPDCNRNAVPDSVDLEKSFGIAGDWSVSLPSSEKIVVRDIDGDSWPDILAGGPDGIWAVYGDGPRGPGAMHLLSGKAGVFVSFDVDGDGDLDFCRSSASCFRGSERLFVSFQEDPRRFVLRGRPLIGPSADSLVADDYDGDGRIDLACGGSAGIRLLRLSADGALRAAVPIKGPGLAEAAVDLDGDGDPDLVSLEERTASAALSFNDGHGSFAPGEVFVVGKGEVAAADLDGDGDIDLASGGGWVHRNDGRGKFEGLQILQDDLMAIKRIAIAAADLDGDGDLDLARIEGVGFGVYRNDGSGNFEKGEHTRTGTDWLFDLEASDLDGDGRTDVVTSDWLSGIRILRNFGEDDSFGIWTHRLSWGMTGYGRSALTDLDGDGRPDLAVTGTNGACVLEGRGDGSFGSEIPLAGIADGRFLAALDLDGDGDRDLAVGEGGSNAVVSYIQDGRLAFHERGRTEVGNAGSRPAVGDFDGNGLEDLALNLNVDGVGVFHNDGRSLILADVAGMNGASSFLVPGDLDGDGFLDLVSGNSTRLLFTGVIWLFLNDGRGFFMAENVIPHGCPLAGAFVDLHGDGTKELLFASATTGFAGLNSLSSFLNDPVEKTLLLLDRVPGCLLPFDLHGDGDVDLALAQGWLRDSDVPIRDFILRYRLLRESDAGLYEPVEEFPRDELPVLDIHAADLDGTGSGDIVALSQSSVSVLLLRYLAASEDRDGDGVPDECSGNRFRRGDPNADGRLDIADAHSILLHLFLGGGEPPCRKAADADDDGKVELNDAVAILEHLFLGGPPPPPPFRDCGLDITPDDLPCASFAPCAGR